MIAVDEDISEALKILFTISNAMSSIDKLDWDNYKKSFTEDEVYL